MLSDNRCIPFCLTALATALAMDLQANELIGFEPDMPVVLSPVRLQQPLSEVPASVTLISAEQIRQWGVRRLVDVFQYVPGMFVGQELDTNQSGVVYHSGSLSLSRRLEVLVDGRSVYLSTFASVDWDQLNIALEDVERIEVTRGPSASSYGMNAFQGIVNIITRHPSDSRRAAISIAAGNEGRRRGYVSAGFDAVGASHRLSIFGSREGDGGFEAISDKPDKNWHEGINWSGSAVATPSVGMRWQVSRQRTRRMMIGDENFHTAQPKQETINDAASLQLKSLTGERHDWQLRASWQSSSERRPFEACVPTLAYDPGLGDLYRQNPELARLAAYSVLPLLDPATPQAQREQIYQLYVALANGMLTPDSLESYLASQGEAVVVSEQDLALLQSASSRVVAANGLDELACGRGGYDFDERRLSLEFEHTYWWNSKLRSVQGVAARQDQVDSRTFFGGTIDEMSWLAFSSLEYRFQPDWLAFLSVTAENQTGEGTHFSPRFSLLHLLNSASSLRLQYARSHRAPDLAESYLDASVTVNGLSDNYLGSDTGTLFLSKSVDDWSTHLDGEVIHAWEAGYFASLSSPRIMLDVKLFHERMDRLVQGQINLLSGDLTQNGTLQLTGVEWQMDWRLLSDQRVWLVGVLQNRNSLSGDKELELGVEQSVRLAWSREYDPLDVMLGMRYDRSLSGWDSSRAYEQKKWVARVGSNALASGWTWSLSTEYDANAGQVNFERNPRWLSWASLGYQW